VITLRRVLASAAACAVLALGVAWAPITEHLADADVACGSLFAHAHGSNAVPATATSAGNATTANFDACPGSVYDSRTNIALALAGCCAALALLATLTAYRRRRLGLRLDAV